MIGRQIATYHIEAKLGEGGMGIVYKAMDVALDRPVAIKVLSSELAQDPALVERFRAEAKAQAKLSHTNIATLFNFLNVDGHCLIVMEYLDGETFDHMIHRRGSIPCAEAVPLFKQALLGIGFAHRMGIIHRDIKPANIMLNRDGIVKVMDFGIAKALGGRRLTHTGARIGTLAYMSPEQIRTQSADIRSDIYALGVTLYEMLTGRVPFEATSEFQMMSDHLNTPPPRPSRYIPNIPEGIEAAVLRALEKNPAARFQTVDEFGRALESLEGRRMPAPLPVRDAAVDHKAPARPVPVSPPPARPVSVSPVPPSPRPVAVFPVAPSPRPNPVSPAPASPRPKPAEPIAPRRVIAPPPQPRFPGAGISARTERSRLYRFCVLVFGVAALFSLLMWGLFSERPEVLFLLPVLLYFLPMLLAAALHRRDTVSIVRINLLRGWTGIGWVEALRQALADEE